VQRSVQNLVEIGLVVQGRFKQSDLYLY